MLTSWALLPTALPSPVWMGVDLLVVVSLADDVFTLPVWQWLLTHGMAAAWLSTTLLSGTHGWLIVIMAAVAIICDQSL